MSRAALAGKVAFKSSVTEKKMETISGSVTPLASIIFFRTRMVPAMMSSL